MRFAGGGERGKGINEMDPPCAEKLSSATIK
jgi:hypothetical protein